MLKKKIKQDASLASASIAEELHHNAYFTERTLLNFCHKFTTSDVRNNYETAIYEIKNSPIKIGHYSWTVFPQLRTSLTKSAISKKYAFPTLHHAKYWFLSSLGDSYREYLKLILERAKKEHPCFLRDFFGNDCGKLMSSLQLHYFIATNAIIINKAIINKAINKAIINKTTNKLIRILIKCNIPRDLLLDKLLETKEIII